MPYKVSPENMLTAVLSQVGEGVRIRTDAQFTRLFDEYARTFNGNFSQFKMHPQYKFSRILDGAISTLLLGGTLVRDGLSEYIRPSNHAVGYGRRVFEELDRDTREIVSGLGNKIREAYLSK